MGADVSDGAARAQGRGAGVWLRRPWHRGATRATCYVQKFRTVVYIAATPNPPVPIRGAGDPHVPWG